MGERLHPHGSFALLMGWPRSLCTMRPMAGVPSLYPSAARRGGCSPRRGTHGPAPTRRWVARAVGAGAATRGQAASQPGCRGGECVLCGVGERLALGSGGWVGAGSAGRLPPPRVQSEPTGAPRRGGVSRDRVEGGEPWGRSSRRRARGWTAWGDGAARRVRGDGGGEGPAGRSGDGRLLRGGCKVEGPRAVRGAGGGRVVATEVCRVWRGGGPPLNCASLQICGVMVGSRTAAICQGGPRPGEVEGGGHARQSPGRLPTRTRPVETKRTRGRHRASGSSSLQALSVLCLTTGPRGRGTKSHPIVTRDTSIPWLTESAFSNEP